MRMRRLFFVFGLLYSMPATVPALAAEELALPRLPVSEFPLLPSSAGMRFFEGVWQPLSHDSFRVSKTFTVTDKIFSRADIVEVRPYGVLAERENYILLASYDRVGVTEYVYWTRFVILYLRYFNAEREGHPEQADMVYNNCSDDRLKDGEKGYRLPKAALLRIFASSYCRKEIGATKPPTRLWLAEEGWSSEPFSRITDANRGTGWRRMRRNEMILGVPQRTVPEPRN